MTPIEYPYWIWITFFSVVLVASLSTSHRQPKAACADAPRDCSLERCLDRPRAGFGVFIYTQFGLQHAKLYLTGYLIELSLSVDNLFVFLLIFSYFKVPKKFQHRVLFGAS